MTDTAPEVSLLEEGQALIEAAGERGLLMRLLGGLAIRLVCPDLPPRTRTGQDLDFCSLSSTRKNLTTFLGEHGYVPDKMFNALHGDKQLYFTHGEQGHAIDILLDKLQMCHTLDFSTRLGRLPYTLEPVDLLLSKLQIVELNEKDADDCLRLLVTHDLRDADDPSSIDLRVVRDLVGNDWGWWRTVTLNLERIRELLGHGERPAVAGGRLDPLAQLSILDQATEDVPKSRGWRMRAKIGERKRWYEQPDETAHD
jgi:hypothetical protein